MLKYVLIICVVILAASASQRERIWEDTAFLREPFHKRAAASQVDGVAHLIESNAARGRPLPTRLDFDDLVEVLVPDPARRVDPWGTPYYLHREFGAIRVGSAGPDRKIGTEDDILSRVVRAPGPPARQ